MKDLRARMIAFGLYFYIYLFYIYLFFSLSFFFITFLFLSIHLDIFKHTFIFYVFFFLLFSYEKVRLHIYVYITALLRARKSLHQILSLNPVIA